MFFERRKRRQKFQRGNAGGHTGIERWRRPVVLLLCIAMVSMYSGVIPSVSAAGDDVPGTEAATGEISGDTNTGDNSTVNTQEPGNTETTGNAAENQNPQEPSESSEPVGCKHHPVHTEECGYTDENPVCGFVCAVCSVQKQIDEIINGWGVNRDRRNGRGCNSSTLHEDKRCLCCLSGIDPGTAGRDCRR